MKLPENRFGKPAGLKYFVYARKSSESEDKQVASIASQIDELKTVARREGLKIVETFTEEKSAKAPGRPVFTRMIERIHSGEAQGIICWKLDRLARNPIDGGTISWMLQQGAIQHIQTYQRSYLPTDNVLMMSVEFGSANQFILDLSLNTKRGIRRKVQEGWLPHKPPIGYLNNKYSDPNKPPIYKDPERFDLIKKMWGVLLQQQHSLMQMKQLADDWGLRSTNGKKLYRSKIYDIFTNPFYYGVIRWEGEIYPAKHEPMITQAEFEQAQKILSGRYNAKPHYRSFAFTGLMRCGECGAGITAEAKTKIQKNGNVHHYTYYRCSKAIDPHCSQKTLREERLEEQILDTLGQITIPAEFHQWAIKHLKEEQANEIEDREKISKSQQTTLDSCKRRLDALLSLRLNDEIDAQEFKRAKAELISEKNRLEELIGDANYRMETWLDRAEKTLAFAETAKERFEAGDLEAKKEILACLGSNLILRNRTLSLRLNPPLEMVSQVAPEVQALHESLEPTQVPATQEDWEALYAQNEKWGGRGDADRTRYIDGDAMHLIIGLSHS